LQGPLAEWLLAGDVQDGERGPGSDGKEGWLVADRISRSNRQPPEGAVVH